MGEQIRATRRRDAAARGRPYGRSERPPTAHPRAAGRRPGHGDRDAGAARRPHRSHDRRPSRARKTSPRRTCVRLRTCGHSSTSPLSYDPLLLQADETNPVFSDSTFQGFALDPFPPIGTKIGSFLLFTTVESDVDYNSNIFASPEAVGDTALEVRPAGAPRVELEPARRRGARERRSQFSRPVSDGRRPRLSRRRPWPSRRDQLHQFAGLDCPRAGAGKPLGHQRSIGGNAARRHRQPSARGLQTPLQPAHSAAARRYHRHGLRQQPVRRHGAEQRRPQLHALRSGGAAEVGVFALPLRVLRHRLQPARL